jgi:hypothetical protein
MGEFRGADDFGWHFEAIGENFGLHSDVVCGVYWIR